MSESTQSAKPQATFSPAWALALLSGLAFAVGTGGILAQTLRPTWWIMPTLTGSGLVLFTIAWAWQGAREHRARHDRVCNACGTHLE